MDKEKTIQQLTEELRVNQIAMVRDCVKRLLLARYGVLLKAQAYQIAQRDNATAYESFHVFPSYEAGDDQPLVEWLRLHKDRGLPVSSGLWDFLIEAVQGKRSRTRGKKKSTTVEQRDLRLAIDMASFMYLNDSNYDDARARVVTETGKSESMIGRAYNRFAIFFSKEITLPLQLPR